MKAKFLAVGMAVALWGACGSEAEEGSSGSTTGAVCDESVTYDNFVADFAADYCTRCHASDLDASQREGAPLGHDLDTEAGILAVLEHVEEVAAAGPDGVNDAMPPSGDKPSLEEREKLGAWIACQDAEGEHEHEHEH
jgi:uncharacterized membrane protein